MARKVNYIHVRYYSDISGDNSESWDDVEYEGGLFTMDDIVKEAVSNGASKIVIEVRTGD
jgi:hypothetical protein